LAKDGMSLTNVIGYGQRVHHDRLRGRSHQQFTTADVGHPWDSFAGSQRSPEAWPKVQSATAGRVSTILEGWLAGIPPAAQVFRMRGVGLLLVSVAVALAGALMVRGTGAQAGEHWLGWCLVMVPSLAYFTLGASVEPIELACTVVLGAAMASMVNRGDPSWRVMLLVGWVLGILVHTSMTAVLTSVAVPFGLLGLALFRAQDPAADGESRPSSSIGVLGWGAMAAGLLLARVISTEDYDLATAPAVREFLGWTWVPPYWCAVLLGCGGLWAVERMADAMKWVRPGSHGRRPLWLQPLALAIVLGMCWNMFRPATQLGMLTEAVPVWESLMAQERLLPLIGLPAPSDVGLLRGAFVRAVVESFLSSWGPGDADHRTSVLFWQLDGPQDTLLPGWVRQFLTVMLACGLALSLWRISERRNVGRLGRLAMVLAGVSAALILLALGSWNSRVPTGINARTLLGVHVLLIPVMFLGWKGLMVRWESTSPRKLGFVLVLPMLLLQGTAIVTTIHRYLG
jgi:hypothetical protein